MKRTVFVLGILTFAFATVPAARAAWFVRGDANGSGGVNLSDAVVVLGHLFAGGPALPCPRAADLDDDGKLSLGDPVLLLNFLFLGGPAPGAPFPACGFDPTDDDLGCSEHPPCASAGVFFCFDISAYIAGARFKRLKADAVRAIDQLSEGDQFAVVFFDSNLVRFPISSQPADADPEMKSHAEEFIQAVSSGHYTCSRPALVKCLDYAALSTASHKSITYVSDGYNTCPNSGSDAATYAASVLAEVAARNVEKVPIHTIGIGAPGEVNEAWLKELAAQSGGTYTRRFQ